MANPPGWMKTAQERMTTTMRCHTFAKKTDTSANGITTIPMRTFRTKLKRLKSHCAALTLLTLIITTMLTMAWSIMLTTVPSTNPPRRTLTLMIQTLLGWMQVLAVQARLHQPLLHFPPQHWYSDYSAKEQSNQSQSWLKFLHFTCFIWQTISYL